MIEDQRTALYRNLHGRQLSADEAINRKSAYRILSILHNYCRPMSVLDVGCGLGTWLHVAEELGANVIQGVEGNWLVKEQLQIDPSLVTILDLEQGFDLSRKFDLAICLEVAEHLSPAAGDPLVASLVKHADVVLFSAAIPYQGGTHHVNEQFPSYWAERFAHHDYVPIDPIRPQIWTDREIHWWLRQNILLFAHPRALEAYPKLADEVRIERPLDLVHPEVFMGRMRGIGRRAREYDKVLRIFGKGGVFTIMPQPGGGYSISRER